jgi:uncharacterized protein (DUF885 family)
MLRFFRPILAATVLLLAACSGPPAPPPTQSAAQAQDPGKQLGTLVEQYWDEYLRRNPQYLPEGAQVRFDPGGGADVSPQFLADSLALERRYLDAVRALPRERLASDAQLSYDIFVRERELAVESFTYPSELMPVNPFRSMPLEFARASVLDAASSGAKAYARWEARSEQYLRWTREAIANMRDGMRRGYTMPREVVSDILPMLAALGTDTPSNPLYAGSPGAEARVRAKVLPAYRELHDFLRNEYLPRARSAPGLSALPLGEAWYAFLIRRETGSHLKAAELHAIGLADLERLRVRMQAVLAEAGFAGNAQAFAEAMHHGSHAAGSADELLGFYSELKEQAASALPALFEETPQADFTLLPVEAYREATAPDLGYERAPLPGTLAIVYVDTGGLEGLPRVPAVAQFLRVAIPGQHFQIAIQAARDLPRFRRFGGDPGFVDGWAMYAASLGEELGLDRDAESKFSALSAQMECDAGLVIDTGLNALGWSTEQAFEFLRAQLPIDEATARKSVDRGLSLPGEALACAIGGRTLQSLRSRAREVLGGKFDVHSFHAQILDTGSMPLDILEAKVNLWLNAAR